MYTPKHLCQIYQAWLVLQMTPALLVQYTQPVVLLQLCQQVRCSVRGQNIDTAVPLLGSLSLCCLVHTLVLC